jgi:hypothetical protein
MAKLKFPLDEVLVLLNHAHEAPEHYEPYEPDSDPGPGLVLVGDQGVYLCSNGTPGIPKDETVDTSSKYWPRKVAYAQGINPDVDDFETWWGNKNATFGGDDGAELFTMNKDMLDGLSTSGKKWFTVTLTETSLKLGVA